MRAKEVQPAESYPLPWLDEALYFWLFLSFYIKTALALTATFFLRFAGQFGEDSSAIKASPTSSQPVTGWAIPFPYSQGFY